MDSDAVFETRVECSSCVGSGISYDKNSCHYCGGHGFKIERIDFGGFKDEIWDDILNRIKRGDGEDFVEVLLKDRNFIDHLLEHPLFVDSLLEKVGHKMEPEDEL